MESNNKNEEESNFVKRSREELKLAGLFDKDSDYDGMIGTGVMELIKVFSSQGHSGYSASIVSTIFKRLVDYKLLTPIEKPKEGEYKEGVDGMLQSTRLYSLFSEDKGKTWYDIDAKDRTPVKFPYMPGE